MMGLPRSTFYQVTRGYKAQPPGLLPHEKMRKRLQVEKEQKILDYLYSERFADCSPTEVYYTLLDEGIYLGSISKFYRLLREEAASGERRPLRKHPRYARPELMATGPNQVWTWDITKIRGPLKGKYYSLYVVLDLYSRYVVGWLIADKESSQLAERLISDCCEREGIQPGQLTIHSDRGAPMQAQNMVQLHAQLGVTKSNSRPYVSNDNPFSESAFKTLKYHPTYPGWFTCIEDAIRYFREFFGWYCFHHRHSGIAYLTPADVHRGRASAILEARQRVLLSAYNNNPRQFPHGAPYAPKLPAAVYINPPLASVSPPILSV